MEPRVVAEREQMGSREPADLTGVLEAARNGDDRARNELFERVYDQLRRMAHAEMNLEHRRPTMLQTTALVNEAWVKLAGNQEEAWKNRSYFFGAAVNAMRRILIDYARKRNAQRRGGGAAKVTLDDDARVEAPRYDLLALDEALDRLASIRPRAAQVVGYRFFLGMSIGETASQLEISERLVSSDWDFARRWLERELTATPSDPRQHDRAR